MASAKVKPIHLIQLKYGCVCSATCDRYYRVVPIETFIKECDIDHHAKGTFDPRKVTCKRCLKHPKYKEAMDRVKYPLFFLKENG